MPTETESGAGLPGFGRLAGIDYGHKRVGVALCDARRQYCGPHDVYHRRTDALDAAYFQKLVREEGIVGLVVGLPLHTEGEESQSSQSARAFGDWLGRTTGLPVIYQDERYTSHAAEQLLGSMQLTKKKRASRLDALAAQIILQSYVDRHPAPG